jgi:hypothetical protein
MRPAVVVEPIVLFALGDLQFGHGGNFQGKFGVQLQTGLILVDALEYFFYRFAQSNDTAVNGRSVLEPVQKLSVLAVEQFLVAIE